MLDATERKTLIWCAFVAGVLCLIPGETPKGPKPLDFLLQLGSRMIAHHATQMVWALALILCIHHILKTRKEEDAAQKPQPEAPAAETPP